MSKIKATKAELVELLEEVYTYGMSMKDNKGLCYTGEELIEKLSVVLNKDTRINDITIQLSLDSFDLHSSIDPLDPYTYEVTVKLTGSNKTIGHSIYDVF